MRPLIAPNFRPMAAFLLSAAVCLGCTAPKSLAEDTYTVRYEMKIKILNDSSTDLLFDHAKSKVNVPLNARKSGQGVIKAHSSGTVKYYARALNTSFFDVSLKFNARTSSAARTLKIDGTLNRKTGDATLSDYISAESENLRVTTSNWDVGISTGCFTSKQYAYLTVSVAGPA